MSNCVICGERPSAKQKINCKCCSKAFHANCINVKDGHIPSYNSGEYIWLCDNCNSKVISNKNQQSPVADSVTMSEIRDTLRALLDKQNHFIEKLEKHSTEIEQLKSKDIEHGAGIRENRENIEKLELQMKSVLEENNSLRQKCNKIQQSSMNNCLVVTGVPLPKNENVFLTTQLKGSALGMRLTDSHVVNSYRFLGAGRKNSNLIICFTKQSYRDEFLKCRKIKRDFSTKDLDKSLSNLVSEPNVIYVNEYLTAYNKNLFLKAKEYKNDNNIKYLWIKNGSIYMRKLEGTRAVLITSENDFQNIQ
ncbi:unnamed protein product [Phaedon cochleariae]|uniref:PHD-type domain-containing protein n=1 Tax=Phaedon cochleariae TaxID=80249 RepID=A0A9N9SEZ7_PHACE|nr:unnamed protein product [Phaedon cochleariae]